jgi:hypothetical protein
LHHFTFHRIDGGLDVYTGPNTCPNPNCKGGKLTIKLDQIYYEDGEIIYPRRYKEDLNKGNSINVINNKDTI